MPIHNPHGNSRKGNLEQYYTTRNTANQVCKRMILGLLTHNTDVKLDEYIWVEPCAGKGVFYEALVSEDIDPNKIIPYDIEPKHERVNKADFFKIDICPDIKNIVVITNPPFGRGSRMAINFFNHCAEFAQYIGMIVPSSWKNKFHVHDKLNLNFHKICEMRLPEFSFEDENGDPYTKNVLNCVFQVWQKSEVERYEMLPYRSNDFKFVWPTNRWERFKKVNGKNIFDKDIPAIWSHPMPDFIIRTHGHKSGQILNGFNHNTRTSIGVVAINDEVRKILKECDFTKFLKSNAYIPSLAPAEISWIYDRQKNEILKRLEKEKQNAS